MIGKQVAEQSCKILVGFPCFRGPVKSFEGPVKFEDRLLNKVAKFWSVFLVLEDQLNLLWDQLTNHFRGPVISFVGPVAKLLLSVGAKFHRDQLIELFARDQLIEIVAGDQLIGK